MFLFSSHFSHVYYVEMACNGLFGAGEATLISPPNLDKSWILSKAQITVRDNEVHSLMVDFEIIIDLIKVEENLQSKERIIHEPMICITPESMQFLFHSICRKEVTEVIRLYM